MDRDDVTEHLLAEAELVPRLADLEESILDWLVPAVDRFDPLDWADREAVPSRRKAFNELSVCLYVLDQLGEAGAPEPLRDLVVRCVNDDRYQHLTRRHPDKFLLYSFPFAYAQARGELGTAAEATVQDALADPTVWATERPPFRLLDLWHFCRLVGFERAHFELDTILSLSCLARPPDIVTATSADVYALTHDLLFYHNFGVPHPSFPSGPTSYDLETTLTGLLLRSIASGDTDLAVEILSAGVLERCLSPTVVRFAVTWIAGEVEDDGYVRGPTTDNRPSVTGADPDDPWLANYHTNLATLIAIRIVRDRWPAVRARPEESSAVEVTPSDLRQLGELATLLREYDLAPAATVMTDLVDSAVVDRYPSVFEASVDFLRRQRRPDGHYGFWTDEKALYLEGGGDPTSFETELLEPTTEACRAALEAVRSRTGAGEPSSAGGPETELDGMD